MLVSAADEGSRIEISADDETVLGTLFDEADVATQPARQGSNHPLFRRLNRPRLLRHLRPLGMWVGGIASALVVAYLIYRLGWNG